MRCVCVRYMCVYVCVCMCACVRVCVCVCVVCTYKCIKTSLLVMMFIIIRTVVDS